MDYWIAIDKQKIGPLSLDEVRRRRLAPETLVWHKGLPTWREAGSLPELADSLAGSENMESSETSEVTVDSESPENTGLNATPTPPPTPVPPAYREPAIRYAMPNAMKPQTDPIPEKPATYLGWNIAAIILCCFITGIIGVIYSSKVSSRYDMGDYDGARRASETAGLLLIISIVAGLVLLPFQILMNLL